MTQHDTRTKSVTKIELDGPDDNRDPISGTPGAHPVGTGVGAVGGGAAGAMVGMAVGGPVGSVAGAVVGGVLGGLGGKATAEALNPTIENEYWRTTYVTRPYVDRTFTYEEDYRPAYTYGWDSYSQHGRSGRRYDEVESELSRGWDRAKGSSRLNWEKAKGAARDA